MGLPHADETYVEFWLMVDGERQDNLSTMSPAYRKQMFEASVRIYGKDSTVAILEEHHIVAWGYEHEHDPKESPHD